MSYGSNEAVKAAEDDCREQRAQLIALRAAELVAARNMGRAEAIEQAAAWDRREQAADGDLSGVAAVENTFPVPSKASPTAQVKAIAVELLDAARDAVGD